MDEDIIYRGRQDWGLTHDDVLSMSIKVNDQRGLELSSDVLSHEGTHTWELSNKINPIVNFIADNWYARTDLSQYADFDWGTYENPIRNPEFVSKYSMTDEKEYLERRTDLLAASHRKRRSGFSDRYS